MSCSVYGETGVQSTKLYTCKAMLLYGFTQINTFAKIRPRAWKEPRFLEENGVLAKVLSNIFFNWLNWFIIRQQS